MSGHNMTYDPDKGWMMDHELGLSCNCDDCVSEYREELAESVYAGPCPFGYGPCYAGSLCGPDSNAAALADQGLSSGCAYTRPPQ